MLKRQQKGGKKVPAPRPHNQNNPKTPSYEYYNQQHVRPEGMEEDDSSVNEPPSPTLSEYLASVKTIYSKELRQSVCFNNGPRNGGPAMTYSKRESFAATTTSPVFHTNFGSHGLGNDSRASGASSNSHHPYYDPPIPPRAPTHNAAYFESRYDAPPHSRQQRINPGDNNGHPFPPPAPRPAFQENGNHKYSPRQAESEIWYHGNDNIDNEGHQTVSTVDHPSSAPSDMTEHVSWWRKIYSYIKGCFIGIHKQILAARQQNAEDVAELRRFLHIKLAGIEDMLGQIPTRGELQARAQQSEEELSRITKERNELNIERQELLWQVEHWRSKAESSESGGQNGGPNGGQSGVGVTHYQQQYQQTASNSNNTTPNVAAPPQQYVVTNTSTAVLPARGTYYSPHYQRQQTASISNNKTQNAAALSGQYVVVASTSSAASPTQNGGPSGGPNGPSYHIPHQHEQQQTVSNNHTPQNAAAPMQQYVVASTSSAAPPTQNCGPSGGQGGVGVTHYPPYYQQQQASSNNPIHAAPVSRKRSLPATSTTTYSAIADIGECPAPKHSRMSVHPPLGGPQPMNTNYVEEAPMGMGGSMEVFDIGDVMGAIAEGDPLGNGHGNGESHHFCLVGGEQNDEDMDMGDENQNEDVDNNDEDYGESDDEEDVEDRSWLPEEYKNIELPVRPQSLPRLVVEAINPISREKKCLMCPKNERKIYATAKIALRHALSAHGYPLRCPICKAEFKRKDDFTTHLNTHSTNC